MSRSRFLVVRIIACWACGVAAGLFPGIAGAQGLDHDAMLKAQRQQREMQYGAIQTMVASFPALPAKEIREVMQLKMDGNALVLAAPLLDAGHETGNYRLACNEFKGPTFVSVSQMGMPIVFGPG